MPSVYTYIMVADMGESPCYDDRITTLCICKPAIRRTASVGDLVVAIAGKMLSGVSRTHNDRDLVWMGRVAGIMSMGDYGRKHSNRLDSIYRINGADGVVRQLANPWHDFTHATQDLSGRRCLFFDKVHRFSRSSVSGRQFVRGIAFTRGHLRTQATHSAISTTLARYGKISDRALRQKSVLLGMRDAATMRRNKFTGGGSCRVVRPRAAPRTGSTRRPGFMSGGNCKHKLNDANVPNEQDVANADVEVPEDVAGDAAPGEAFDAPEFDNDPVFDDIPVDAAVDADDAMADAVLDQHDVVAAPGENVAAVLAPLEEAGPRRGSRNRTQTADARDQFEGATGFQPRPPGKRKPNHTQNDRGAGPSSAAGRRRARTPERYRDDEAGPSEPRSPGRPRERVKRDKGKRPATQHRK